MNAIRSTTPLVRKSVQPEKTFKQDLNFYNDIPSHELSIDEFEELALARLKVRFLHSKVT